MKTVLEMKSQSRQNQSSIVNYFKPKAGTGEENVFPVLLSPIRNLEDLDLALNNKSVDLPELSKLNDMTDALSVEDDMKLWTILGFLEDHAKGYLLSNIIIPDLDSFRDMLFQCKTKFLDLLEIYQILFMGTKKGVGRKESIDCFVLPEILSRYFLSEGNETLGEILSSTEFVDLIPSLHIEIMYQLVDVIVQSNSFREHVMGFNEIIAQLNQDKDKKLGIKESSILAIGDYEAKIVGITKKLDLLSKSNGVIDLDEEECIIRSRSRRKQDAQEEENKMETIKSLIGQREILETKKKAAHEKIEEIDCFLSEERLDIEEAQIRLHGNPARFCGYDRNGRLYWRFPVSRKMEGLIVETIFYYIFEDDLDCVEDKPLVIEKTSSSQKKKKKSDDESSDLSSYNPSDFENTGIDVMSDIVLADNNSTVRLELTSLFEYINSQSNLMDLQNALLLNGARESVLKKELKSFISQNQECIFSDDKDAFFTSFVDWIYMKNQVKEGMTCNKHNQAVLEEMNRILPYILVGLHLPLPETLCSDLNQCIEICQSFKDTSFNRNKQLYKELSSIRTFSAMIHWLQRAESYVAYLIQKEEIEELRHEKREAKEQASTTSSIRQVSTQENSGESTRSSNTRSSQQNSKSIKSKSSQRSKNSSSRRTSGRTDRKNYSIRIELTSSESSESSESDSQNKRRSQRMRLKKRRHIESDDSQASPSDDEILVSIDYAH